MRSALGKVRGTVLHEIAPVYDENSRVLSLGSFPSVRSREEGFFYCHPQNRFWRVLGVVFEEAVPVTVEEKRHFLLSHGIALWDVIASCEIAGSADSSIRNAVPNDLNRILQTSCVERVVTNGKTADAYYRKYQEARTGKAAICLPSTSPANAAFGLFELIAAWRVLKE